MKIKQHLLKFISPNAPLEARLAAAQLIDTEARALPPDERVTMLFVLMHDKDAQAASAAQKSFEGIAAGELLDALDTRLDPLVIRKITELFAENDAVLTMAALNPDIDNDTLMRVAKTGPEEMLAALAGEDAMIAARPWLKEAMRANPRFSEAVISAAHEDSAAVSEAQDGSAEGSEAQEAAPALSVVQEDKGEEAIKKLVAAKARTKEDEHNIAKLIKDMTISQKVKLAMSGNKSARELLIKESNKMVSSAVLKNPRITENEILRLTSVRGTSEDLLRGVARNKEWMKNYPIKFSLTTNAKTPLAISMKLMDSLNDADVQKIGKSKNVPSTLANAARRKIDAKVKRH
ncbi:MAG: hypothetical protein HY886_00325 [Deltaproteobacteria bacterium]|nr:hypothetical protein [Deltaproteobacteria bacterium]